MVVWSLQIASDYTEFNFVDDDDENRFEELVKEFFEEGKPLSEKWKPFSMIRGELKKHPDFFEIGGTRVIAMSERALDYLSQYIVKTEFLPIDTDCGKYYAINTLNIIDCLDKEESSYTATDQGIVVRYRYLDLFPEKFASNRLFKIPEMPYSVLVTSFIMEECELEDFMGLEMDVYSNLVWHA